MVGSTDVKAVKYVIPPSFCPNQYCFHIYGRIIWQRRCNVRFTLGACTSLGLMARPGTRIQFLMQSRSASHFQDPDLQLVHIEGTHKIEHSSAMTRTGSTTSQYQHSFATLKSPLGNHHPHPHSPISNASGDSDSLHPPLCPSPRQQLQWSINVQTKTKGVYRMPDLFDTCP